MDGIPCLEPIRRGYKILAKPMSENLKKKKKRLKRDQRDERKIQIYNVLTIINPYFEDRDFDLRLSFKKKNVFLTMIFSHN